MYLYKQSTNKYFKKSKFLYIDLNEGTDSRVLLPLSSYRSFDHTMKTTKVQNLHIRKPCEI